MNKLAKPLGFSQLIKNELPAYRLLIVTGLPLAYKPAVSEKVWGAGAR